MNIYGLAGQQAKLRISCRYLNSTFCLGGPPKVASSFAPKCPQWEILLRWRQWLKCGQGHCWQLTWDFSEIPSPPENPGHTASGTGGQDRAVWAVEIPRQRQLHPGPCICQREDPNVWAIEVGQRESTGPRVCHSLVPGAHCASPPWFWNRLSSEGDLTKPLAWWGFWEILSWRNLLHSG